MVKGDGDLIWGTVIADCVKGAPQRIYDGGSGLRPVVRVGALGSAAGANRYMWASVQTVRGCPKHCSFCSVWRTDGQQPRQRAVDAVVEEIVDLRRRGFRFIALADDNFYPVALADLAQAARRQDPSRLRELEAIRAQRFELMERLSRLPDDMVFYTQITMEAAEDVEFLEAMRRAHIRGALVGVESVTPEGLKDVYKGFNLSGDALVERLQTFSKHGDPRARFVHLRTAERSARDTSRRRPISPREPGVTFAQFVMLTPFPGTVDFEKWEREAAKEGLAIEGVPDHAALADSAGTIGRRCTRRIP